MPRLTPRSRAAVLALATGAGRAAATTPRARGTASAVHLGRSFEDAVEAVWALSGKAMRGQPVAKVVGKGPHKRTVYTAKNGVDFVGVLHGYAVALEVKRLPGAASLSGAKDDSTRAEAAWLLDYRRHDRSRAGFLVFDPEADAGRGTLYVVQQAADLARIAAGVAVLLRTRGRQPCVPAWSGTDIDAALREVVWPR